MLRLGYLVFKWVAVWKESDMQLISELANPNQGPQGRGSQLFRFSQRAPPSPPPGSRIYLQVWISSREL